MSTTGAHKRARTSTHEEDDTVQAEAAEPSPSGGTLPGTGGARQTQSTPASGSAVKAAAMAKFNTKWKVNERTTEEILEAQIARWKSPVYAHFLKPEPLPADTYGDIRYKFVCRRHPSEAIIRSRTDDSTGNLIRHVEGCDSKIAPPGQAITNYANGSTYTKARMRYMCARWVVRRHRPFVIVQDPELLDIFRMLLSRVEVPHPTTLSRDVKEIHALASRNIARMLQDYLGRLHICIDGWTSPNVIAFLGITVHFVTDGKMASFILDFVKLTKSHTGSYLFERLADCLRSFGIEKKLFAIVADNASNNNTLVAESESLGGINSAATRVRCFAHILNLVVKAITSGFTKKKSSTAGTASQDEADGDGDEGDLEDTTTGFAFADDEAEAESDKPEDEYEFDKDREAADDRDIEAIIEELEYSEHSLSAQDELAGRKPVWKLVELAKRVFNSPNIREDLKSSCEWAKIESKQMKKAVPTRWNSLAEAIGRALELRQAIDRLLSMTKYDKKGKDGLRRFKLNGNEWLVLTQLFDVLKGFLRATELVSKSDTPLLHEVIPLMDILTQTLTGTVTNSELARPVRVAAVRGLKVLDKYYATTSNDSLMYRGAMIFHPKYKLEYFRRHRKWPAQKVRMAEQAVRDMWENHYKITPTNTDTARTNSASASATTDIFSSLDTWGGDMSDGGDALDEYLSSPVFSSVKDPLQWWNSQLAGGNALARMALDFLSAPASSVDVERAFSRGGLTVSKRRHALSDESTRCATVLSSWMGIPEAIPEKKIIKVFEDKNKRSKKTDVSNVFADLSDNEMTVISDDE